jgi:GntR family transcriptional regulator
MNISINTKSGIPIYEQIERAFKDMIVRGELKEGEPLPSIRGLAADLRISVITIKRAYEDLEKEGMIYSVQGKGFYVDNPDLQYLKEKKTLGLEEKLTGWIDEAKASGMNVDEAVDMIRILWD